MKKKMAPAAVLHCCRDHFFPDATSDFYRDFMPGFEVEYQMLVIVNRDVADYCVPENIIEF